MKKLFGILIGVIAAIVLVLVLAGIVLPMIYDKEDLKSAISAQVQEHTGRQLRIDGDLDFSVFPWLAIEVNQLSLGNAPGFGEKPFAEVGRARVGVALIPLFRQQLAADEVLLEGVHLFLEVDAKGQSNWADLAADKAPSEQSTESGEGLFSNGRIAGLKVREAQVDFHDAQAGTHYRMERFKLETGALGDGRPVDVALAMALEDVGSGWRADLESSAVAKLDFAQNRHDLEKFELELALVPGDGGRAQTLIMQAPALRADLGAQTLDIEAFTFSLGSVRGSGALEGRGILDHPAVSGAIEVEEFSPTRLLQDMGQQIPVTADPNVLQKARLSASFAGGGDQLELADFDMELDQSNFAGEMRLANFDQPSITFDFEVDTIDIDRYLEPAPENAAAEEALAIPSEELRGQDVQGTLRVGALRLAGLDFTDAVVGLKLAQGRLRVDPLAADFYGGRYSGDITLDGSGATPTLTLDQKIDAVTLRNLIAAASNTESLSGMAVGQVSLTGRGATSSEMLKSLQGNVALNLSDGALEGINLWYEIRRGLALFKGQPPPAPEPNRTVFTRMQFEAAVQDGVINSRQLLGELPFLTLSGTGSIDLGKSAVDMSMVANVRNIPELSNDPLSAELRGKQLPFRITGSLEDPGVAVDWAALLKGEATNMLMDKLGLAPASPAAGLTSGKTTASGSEPADAAEKLTPKQQAKEQAKGLLRGLLGPKKPDPKEDEDSDDGG